MAVFDLFTRRNVRANTNAPATLGPGILRLKPLPALQANLVVVAIVRRTAADPAVCAYGMINAFNEPGDG